MVEGLYVLSSGGTVCTGSLGRGVAVAELRAELELDAEHVPHHSFPPELSTHNYRV